MKKQIRQGVFETNSSNEHSITIMNKDKFYDWKNGKLLARVKSESESEGTWGNFWSRLTQFEFTDDFEKAKKDNENAIELCKDHNIEKLNQYKSDCLNHKKLIEKELTPEELEKLSYEEQDEYVDKEYEDSLYRFDKEYYNRKMNLYNNLTKESMLKHIGISKLWITFDEFWDDFTIDCYSTFQHDDEENNVHVFGKYFHS